MPNTGRYIPRSVLRVRYSHSTSGSVIIILSCSASRFFVFFCACWILRTTRKTQIWKKHTFYGGKNDAKGPLPREFCRPLCLLSVSSLFCKTAKLNLHFFPKRKIISQFHAWLNTQIDCHVCVFVLCLVAWNRVNAALNMRYRAAGWVIHSYYPPISWDGLLIMSRRNSNTV